MFVYIQTFMYIQNFMYMQKNQEVKCQTGK